VRPDWQQRLRAQGQAVRVYLPFGTDWWPYAIRRVGENPRNIVLLGRALLSPRRGGVGLRTLDLAVTFAFSVLLSMRPESSRTDAAVLLPVFRDTDGELRLLLVVRGSRGVHGGQLAFPGGKQEPRDDSLLETALRETEEEIGLAREDVEIVAELEAVDTRTTGYRVHPFLARVHGVRRWRVADGEIAAVVTPLVRALAEPSARVEEQFSFAHWSEPRRVECIALEDGQLVWGLTLRLLDRLMPRLLADEWPL
jgi:8-oxo-dGTP pyrophosphatase MutT (NUDIX family)